MKCLFKHVIVPDSTVILKLYSHGDAKRDLLQKVYPDQTAHQTAPAKLSGKGMINMPENDLRINIFMCANSKTNSMNHFDIHGSGQEQTKKSNSEIILN